MKEYDRIDDDLEPMSNGLATASLVLGIVGLVLCWVPLLNVVLLLTALGLGIAGLNNRAAKAGVGTGQATAGVVMGGVGLVLCIIVMMLIAILMPALGQARTVANRTRSAFNLRMIHQGLFAYAVENKDRFPEQLGVLVQNGMIPAEHFIAPNDPQNAGAVVVPSPSDDLDAINAWIGANSSYIYVYPNAGASAEYDDVILYERLDVNAGDGVNIAFGDGRVLYEPMISALQTLKSAGQDVPDLTEFDDF